MHSNCAVPRSIGQIAVLPELFKVIGGLEMLVVSFKRLCHVTRATAPILLKRSPFELPKIHAQFIGESKITENSVLGYIGFAQEFNLLGVGIYEEEAIIV